MLMNNHLSLQTSLTIVHLFVLCFFILLTVLGRQGVLDVKPFFFFPQPLLNLKC